MIKFSILLNSRGRPTLLNNLLDSIVTTTDDLSSIEIIVGLDYDDPTLSQSLEVLGQYSFCTARVESRPTNLHISFVALARAAIGRYCFILNDDVEFVSVGWDTWAWTALENHCIKFPDGVAYGRTFDISIDRDVSAKYSAFPILSKISCDILGFPMPLEFPGLGGDVATYRIYEALERVVELDITLKHVLHQTIEQVMAPDLTAWEMRQNTYSNRQDWKTCDLSEYINKLQTYIDYKNTKHIAGILDFDSTFYKNCRSNRCRQKRPKCCQDCPIKESIKKHEH